LLWCKLIWINVMLGLSHLARHYPWLTPQHLQVFRCYQHPELLCWNCWCPVEEYIPLLLVGVFLWDNGIFYVFAPGFLFCPTISGEINVITCRDPIFWNAYLQLGPILCPEGIIHGTVISTTESCSPW
jgi:hypothetical protein